MKLSGRMGAVLVVGWGLYLLAAIVLLYFESPIATPMMALGVIPPLALGVAWAILSS